MLRSPTVHWPRQLPSLCQSCALISARPLHTAKSPLIKTIVAPPRAKRQQNTASRQTTGCRRWASSEAVPIDLIPRQPKSQAAQKELPDLKKLSTVVQQSRLRFLSTDGIPTPQLVIAALKTCFSAANAIQPHLSKSEIRSSATAPTASNLLSLHSDGSKAGSLSISQSAPALLKDTINKVSEAAYAIIAHPPVSITPEVLVLYVNIQAKLGKPETLAHVLGLYGSKPKPKTVSGDIQYVEQNPNRADKAIEQQVAETALDTAISAKNLDSAIGIIEVCYKSQAFVRQKLLRKALLPASTVAVSPFAVYALASNFSDLQNSVDPLMATKIAFSGILAYLAFTATIGVIAKTTVNDHMKRVTWAPGMPLRQRWIREEERAALDKVACAWGFKEQWRYGEEGGLEWDSLREYLGIKGMILDRVELMEGMS